MELVLIKIRLIQVTDDLVKEAFIQRALAAGHIKSLTITDIIESHPPDLYDYRVDGKYLEYIISTNELNKLFNVAQQQRLQINSVRFEEFEDCVEISDGGGNIAITCKDPALGSGDERIVYLNKQSIRRYMDMSWEYSKPTKSLEEWIQRDEVAIDVEAGIKLTMYFTIDAPKVPLEDVADAYVSLLRKGVNRVPKADDIAVASLSSGEASYINIFMPGPQVKQLMTSNDVEVSIDGGVATLSYNSTQLIKLDATTLDNYLVKVIWVNLNSLKMNSMDYELINLGIDDIVECDKAIIENSLKTYRKALG